MPPDWLPSTSGPSLDLPGEDEGLGDYIRRRAWACAIVLVLYWLLFTPILFAVVGVVSGSVTVGLLLAPLLGLAGAGGMLRFHGFLEALDAARSSAPLWVRLPAPTPVFVLGFVLGFVLLGSLAEEFTLLLLGSIALGALAAGAFAWGLGLWRDVPERTRGAPLWVRMLLPVPVSVLTAALAFVLLGGLLQDFRLLVLAVAGAGALAAALFVALTGLLADVPDQVRDSSPGERLAGLAVVALVVGLAAFLAALLVLEEMAIALTVLLPSGLAGAALAAWALGWAQDARRAAVSWSIPVRLGVFALATVVLTLYVALLVGPFLPNALVGYLVGLVGALALTIPASVWTRAWRDLGAAFVAAGEDQRFVATLPVLPLGIGLVFLVLVVTTSIFELAYILSVPAGVGLFLLAGIPFGVTRDLPGLVRGRDLPARSSIFGGLFLLLALYAYFAVAFALQGLLGVDSVEAALVGAIVFAGAVLAGLIAWLDLAEGMGEQFEAYGGAGEALILVVTFLLALVVTFLLVALTLGDFRIAFLASVLAAAGVNYVVAHTTGLVGGTREALAALPWWAELGALTGVFLVAFLFGTVAFGSFLVNLALAMVAGALFALGAVVALSRDLELGDDVLEAADETRRARTSILTLAFLAGFLVGLYVAAAALQAAGVSLFGLPFFIALLAGVGAVIALARHRGWEQGVLERVQSRTDKAKTAVVLTSWIGLGVLTGFALQALPIQGPILGIGDPSGLPLTLTLAAGLLVWAWLPVVLFRVARIDRTPVEATREMPGKRRTLASLGWGLLVAAGVLVVLLVVLDNNVISAGIAVVAGYLTALGISARRGEPGDA
jgi:hypothetical protein